MIEIWQLKYNNYHSQKQEKCRLSFMLQAEDQHTNSIKKTANELSSNRCGKSEGRLTSPIPAAVNNKSILVTSASQISVKINADSAALNHPLTLIGNNFSSVYPRVRFPNHVTDSTMITPVPLPISPSNVNPFLSITNNNSLRLPDNSCRSSVSLSFAGSSSMQSRYTQSINNIEIGKSVNILSNFPWFKLPYAFSQTKYNDKFFQAFHIYNKYLALCAYDAINISADSLSTIEATFKRLHDYKLNSIGVKSKLVMVDYKDGENAIDVYDEDDVDIVVCDQSYCSTNDKKGSENKTEEVIENLADINPKLGDEQICNSPVSPLSCSPFSSNSENMSEGCCISRHNSPDMEMDGFVCFGREKTPSVIQKSKLISNLGFDIHFQGDHELIFRCMQDVPIIENDEQFETVLNSVFDCALPDVLRNLEDSYMRFKSSNEYLLFVADLLQ